MKKLFSVLLAAAMLLSLACPGLASSAEASLYASVRAQAGTDVSGFYADRIDGGKISGEALAQYSVTLVTYWAVWSGDALRQIEYLNAIHAQRPDIGVMGILNTDSPGSAEAALAYMQQHGYDMPVFTADGVWQSVLSQAPFLPQTFFVSASGIILEAYPGAFSSLESMIAEADNWVGPEGTYSVRFYDRTGGSARLVMQYLGLLYGDEVEAPLPPAHEGMQFCGWSNNDYRHVTRNAEVFALYSSASPNGDLDGNGVVDAIDVLFALRVSLGILPLLDEYLDRADVDFDGFITANDALIILRMCLHMI